MASDKNLVLQLIGGSTIALERLHEQYSGKIYRTCRRFYLDHMESEEVVQDVFLKIWNNRNNIKPDLSFQAYIFTITKNHILKVLQKKVLRVTLDNYINNLNYSEGHIEEKLFAQESEALIDEIINNLPPQKQKIFLLNRYSDKSIEEIANELGLSKRTIESHIYQTRALIKSKLNLNSFILATALSIWY